MNLRNAGLDLGLHGIVGGVGQLKRIANPFAFPSRFVVTQLNVVRCDIDQRDTAESLDDLFITFGRHASRADQPDALHGTQLGV